MIITSLCMTVKNEEAALERLLKTMSNVADQVVTIDTGSTDRTKEITARYTDEVYDFPWTNNFAATRNAAYQKVVMDYWMWMDANDMVEPEQAARLTKLRENLNPSVDVMMVKYLTGFDENERTSFSYYRERLLRNHEGLQWQGRIHEAVTPANSILHADIEIQHRKETAGDKDRNLKIYETMLNQGELLEPKHQFYYARGLYYHERYGNAVRAFRAFLQGPKGWTENKIDACLHLVLCGEHLEHAEKAIEALLKSFLYDTPRGEACCELGRMKVMGEKYKEATYWYTQALSSQLTEQAGAFVREDCYGLLPAIQLCVCYDRLGDYRRARHYHLKSQEPKPEHPSVRQNQTCFGRILKHPAER